MKWLIGALILLVLAYVFDMGLLIYAIYAVLAVLLLSRWLTLQWANNLKGTRRCLRTKVSVGDFVTVNVTVTNTGWIPIAWCLVEDLMPPAAFRGNPRTIAVQGKRLSLLQLRGGQTHSLEYHFRCNRRGYYQIGPLVLETGDFFGLHRRFRVVSQPSYVTVLPEMVPLSGYEIASRRPIGEIKMSYRIFEDPTRIAGVRRYERGDSLNRIHWRATARTGELHSKVYEPSTIAGATLLLDFHKQSHPASGEPYRSELAIKTAASILGAVYEMDQQIGLVTNARDAVDRIREEGWAADARTRDEAKQSVEMHTTNNRMRPIVIPGRKGPEQLEIILETLARAELTDGLSFPELILETAPRIGRDATVIAILTTVTPETAIALGNLARQGYTVTAILNMFDVEDFARSSGHLIAEGISVHHLRNEDAITDVCRQQVLIM